MRSYRRGSVPQGRNNFQLCTLHLQLNCPPPAKTAHLCAVIADKGTRREESPRRCKHCRNVFHCRHQTDLFQVSDAIISHPTQSRQAERNTLSATVFCRNRKAVSHAGGSVAPRRNRPGELNASSMALPFRSSRSDERPCGTPFPESAKRSTWVARPLSVPSPCSKGDGQHPG